MTGINQDLAKAIARQKIDYKQEQINYLQEKQYKNYSIQREKIINKIIRGNPLRPIKDSEHALNILIAYNRHTKTDYEILLETGKELRDTGVISDVKEYARKNCK